MRQVIKNIFNQWQIAKKHVEQEYRSAGYTNVADRYKDCRLFTGSESVSELAAILFTPEAQEFMVEHHFPNLATFRSFSDCDLMKYDIYLDAGEIELTNPERALIVGQTHATVRIDECASHDIILIRGAKLSLFIEDWGVAHLAIEKGCQITKTVKNHALIL